MSNAVHQVYDAYLGLLYIFSWLEKTTQPSFLIEFPDFHFLASSPPAVKCIWLLLSGQYDLPFILNQHLKEHSNHTENLGKIGTMRKTPELHGIVYRFHFLYYITVTVKEENHHKGGRCSCSSAHMRELQQAVQWCALVLSCEGKPSLSMQFICLHTWVGERPRCEAGDRGRGGGMDGGIRVDVIRKSCCACQQRLALAHMPTGTRRYIYSCTREEAH